MQQYEPTVDSQMTKRLKKKENMHSIRVLFSNVLSNQRKTSQRPIRDKEAITRSRWEFREKNKETDARKNVNDWAQKKKKQFLAPHLTIFNRPCYS